MVRQILGVVGGTMIGLEWKHIRVAIVFIIVLVFVLKVAGA